MGLRGSSSQRGAALHIPAAHHLSTFIGKYMLLLMDMMMIAYAIDATLLSWGILTRKPGYWGLYEIQVTPDTRKTKEMTSGKLHIPSSKRESKNKLLKLSYQSSMACKCQLVSWTLSCFVAVRMKTICSEKSTTRAASTGLMVWKQTVQGAGGKQWGPSTLTPLQACLMLQQQKAAVTGVDPEAAQSYCSDCRSLITGV